MSRSSGANLVILTGSPGSGKTAILGRLKGEFGCVDEPAREVLAEQRATGGRGTWDQDPSLFVHLLLQRSIEKYVVARRSEETVIFDRGIPDCVVYAVRAGTDAAPSVAAVEAFRYQRHVLFLEPWSDIYTTDEERIMSFDDTVSFSERAERRLRTVRLLPRSRSPDLDRRTGRLRSRVHRAPHIGSGSHRQPRRFRRMGSL